VTSSATIKSEGTLEKKHIKLKFEAKEKIIDLEPTQSVLTLPLAVALIFLAYNYDAVISFLTRANVVLQTITGNKIEASSEDSQDDFFQPPNTAARLTKRRKR